jgi:hypothetical protein
MKHTILAAGTLVLALLATPRAAPAQVSIDVGRPGFSLRAGPPVYGPPVVVAPPAVVYQPPVRYYYPYPYARPPKHYWKHWKHGHKHHGHHGHHDDWD